MTDPLPTCPDCGAPLPPESSHSLCPACLMRQALASRTLADAGDKTPQLPPPSPEEIADHFPGYEVLECLGRGGMGAVYKARQKSLNRLVAIKILAPERVGEGRFAERFSIEAELLAKLGHPHIVTIHDFGETGGLFYLVMEFIDGVNLRDLLRDGKLESEQALTIVPPICEALQYAHDKGIVHRDIKPENILLDRDGRVKIADFGIASLVGASGENSGTPPYMAPEQSGGTVDRRADIYALGVVLYEMLTGERPEKDLQAPSKKIHIDVRLDEIVLRAMEKRPEMRYQTADELRSVVDGFPAHSQPPPLPLPAAAPKRGMMRRWWWVFLVMIPLGPIIGLATGAGWASLVPKKYDTAATVEIRPENVEGWTPGWFESEFEKLTSRRVLAAVAEQLDLPANWQVNRDDAVGILKKIITVENIRGTDLVRVHVRHTNHEQAADIVNGVVSNYQRSFGGTVIVHELPILTEFPVSPNVRLFLVLGALGGLLLFPVMAVLLILILHRAFPEKNPAVEGREKAIRWFIHLVWAACASGLVTLWITFISEILTKNRGYLDQSLMTWEDVYGPVIMVLLGGGLLALPIREFRFASPRIWIGAVFVTATITTIAYVLAAPVEDRSFHAMNFIVAVGICALGTSLFGFAAVFGKRKTGSNFVADHSKSALVNRKRWTSIGKYGAALGGISLAVWMLFFVGGQSNSDHDNWGGGGAGPFAHIKVESLDEAVVIKELDAWLTGHGYEKASDSWRQLTGQREVEVRNNDGEIVKPKPYLKRLPEGNGYIAWGICESTDDHPYLMVIHHTEFQAANERLSNQLEEFVATELRSLRQRIREGFPSAELPAGNAPDLSPEDVRSKTVQISGEVTTKRVVELEEPISLLDAMAAAGGWTEKSDLRNIQITIPGTTEAQIHDLTAILNGEAVNPVIAPGSIIGIPTK